VKKKLEVYIFVQLRNVLKHNLATNYYYKKHHMTWLRKFAFII